MCWPPRRRIRTIELCSGLGDNRLTGTVPNTISILSELTNLCVLPFAVGPSQAGCRWPGPQSVPPRPRRRAVRPFRLLQKNGFVGTIPASAALIPKLQTVYALVEPSRAVGVQKPPLLCCDSMFRTVQGLLGEPDERRHALLLRSAVVPPAAVRRAPSAVFRGSFAGAVTGVRCRRAFGNYLEGPVPQSLLAMRLGFGSCAGLL